MPSPPVLALSQGDPAGIGPELLLRLCAHWAESTDGERRYQPLLVAERAALRAVADLVPAVPWDRIVEIDHARLLLPPGPAGDHIWLLEPAVVLDAATAPRSTAPRSIVPGSPTAADARAALGALDLALEVVRRGGARALVTLPVNKEQIARHALPGFRGHTEYLAAACGLGDYGRDYLMAFLLPRLRVALLSAHLPLREALARVSIENVVAAIRCWARFARGRLAVAGLNPHAGEGGLLGSEEGEVLVPAIERARGLGIAVSGPHSPDTVFARAKSGEFEWVLALYHDQGLIAVKTLGFAQATNWTLGLPVLRTSVDHGTAYDRAGRGTASADNLFAVIETTLKLLEGSAPGEHHRDGLEQDLEIERG